MPPPNAFHLLRLLIRCLQELTNEQCEILDLPYGTKLVGEMDEFMIERLTKKGTYEVSEINALTRNDMYHDQDR